MRAIVLALVSLALVSCKVEAPQGFGDPVLALAAVTTKQCRDTRGRFAKCNYTCADGTRVWALSQCPAVVTPPPLPNPLPEPGPAPTGGDVPSPSLAGGADLIANFDVRLALAPSWGTGVIPGIYSPDEGAFRFTCGGEGQILNDDPLLYPGQPGKSHLHKFWGAQPVDASTTMDTLAKVTASNCNYGSLVVNRSAYWMPALLDDAGKARNPDLVSVYYKRQKASSKYCHPETFAQAIGTCVNLPNRIRFIFGWDPTKPDAPAQGMSWYCTSGTGQHYGNLNDLFNSGCAAGATMVADLTAPNCWDGKNLDSPDHRSHVAWGSYGDWGYYKCPSSHPYVIPQTENKVQWTVTADMYGSNPDGTKYSRLTLASDMMKTGAKPGETMHADYMEQWVAAVKKMWTDNCIDKGLDCSGGDLGNGLQIKGASQPSYGWVNPNPVVSLP